VNVAAAEATVEMGSRPGRNDDLPSALPSDPNVRVSGAGRSRRARVRADRRAVQQRAMAYFNWLEDITNEEWNRDLREEIDLVFFLTRAAVAISEGQPRRRREHGRR